MIQNGQIYRLIGSWDDEKYYNIYYDGIDNEFFRKSDGINGDPVVVMAMQSPRNLTDFGFMLENQRKFLYHDDKGVLTLGDEICYFGIEEIGQDIYNIRMPASTLGGYLTMEDKSPIQFAADRKPPKQKWKFVFSTIDPEDKP